VLSANLNGGATLYGGNAAGDPSDGADLMSGATGLTSAAVYGNGGDDTLVVATTNENTRASLFGGQGNDSITFGGVLVSSSYLGGSGNDSLNGQGGADTIDGRADSKCVTSTLA